MKNIMIIFLLTALFSCRNKENTATEKSPAGTDNILELTDRQLQSFTLSSTELQEKIISKTLKLNGKVDVPPQNLVSVSSALGGYVKSIKLLPGMHFRKGEVLAVMEDNQYIQLQQDYLTAKAQLQNAESEYQRQKELNQSKASSDKVFLQAKADYQTLQVSARSLEEKLRLININPLNISIENISRTANVFAPFDGYVTQVFINTGKYVTPSDVLFELVDPKDLHINLKVFEKDWYKIKIGQPMVVYTNNIPDKKYKGEVILIGKNISENRTVDIHAHFEEYDPLIIPGLYMNADIEIPNNKTWALPDESVLTFEGKEYVFDMLGNGKFSMLAVKTGDKGNGWTEIVNAEKLKGKKIVLSGAYTLMMSLKNKADE